MFVLGFPWGLSDVTCFHSECTLPESRLWLWVTAAPQSFQISAVNSNTTKLNEGWLRSINIQGNVTFPRRHWHKHKVIKRHFFGQIVLGAQDSMSAFLFSFRRCNSFIENPSALKKPQAKLKKMHNLGYKNSSPPKEPQPKRVEEVYRALKNGLE